METSGVGEGLRLEGFRVRMYRSIRDSGFVPVFPLTTLVGREQSGKTALLHALLGLAGEHRPHYSLERDWPRGMREPRGEEHVVCSASFRIGESTRLALLAKGVLADDVRGVRVGRTYSGALLVEPWGVGVSDARARSAERIEPDPVLGPIVREHLPALVYAGSESFLPGAVSVDALASGRSADEQNGCAALGRLLLAEGLRADELEGELRSTRARELGARVRERLRLCGHAHPLAIDAERGRLMLFLERGKTRVPLDRLADDVRFSLTLDLRLAAERNGGMRETVLLLDGPGRFFGRAAGTRMRTLFADYVHCGVTLIYTARLPFDIELQHSEQVLVLAPTRQGAMVADGPSPPEERLALRAALGMTGRSSFRVAELNLVVEGRSDATLLRALDELLRRSAQPGLPDAMALTSAQGSHEVVSVSRFLGRHGLGVIALLDSDAAGLSAHAEIVRARHEGPRPMRIEALLLGEAAGLEVAHAAIEDLFPPGMYFEAARQVCTPSTSSIVARVASSSEERAPGSPASRLMRAFESEGQRLPKGRIAEALAARLATLESVAALDTSTARATRRLMRTLRAAAHALSTDETAAESDGAPVHEPG